MSAALATDRSAAATPPPTVLRVLSGTNAGAELRLTQGEWLVGSGPEADITFAEPALAPAHLRILVGPSGIRMVALAAGVFAGADALPHGTEAELVPLAPLRIGETSFAVGPAGADWAAIPRTWPSSAQPLPAEQETAVVVEAAPETRSAAKVAAPPAAVQPPAGRDATASGAPRRRRWSWLALAACILLLLGGGFWAYATGAISPRAVAPGAPAPDHVSTARAVIGTLDFQGLVTVAANSDGRVAISGQLQTEDQARHLAAELRRAGVHAEMSVATDATIIDLATTILRGYGVDATVSVTGPGAVAVRGYGPGTADVETALARLRSDVQGLTTVEDRIVTPERAREMMERRLRGAGLSRALRIAVADHRLTVSGLLGAEALPAWNEAAEWFRGEYGDRIRLEVQIASIVIASPRGVHVGRTPYLVLEDGRRLGVGDTFDTIGRILAIDSRRVRVQTVLGPTDLPYARSPNWITEDRDDAAR